MGSDYDVLVEYIDSRFWGGGRGTKGDLYPYVESRCVEKGAEWLVVNVFLDVSGIKLLRNHLSPIKNHGRFDEVIYIVAVMMIL